MRNMEERKGGARKGGRKVRRGSSTAQRGMEHNVESKRKGRRTALPVLTPAGDFSGESRGQCAEGPEHPG
jgi:hypothetical protein